MPQPRPKIEDDPGDPTDLDPGREIQLRFPHGVSFKNRASPLPRWFSTDARK